MMTASTVPPTMRARGNRRGSGGGSVAATLVSGASIDGTAIADSRIEIGIEKIGGEVDDHEQDRHHQDDRLHQRKVMPLDRKEQHSSDPGITEDGFDDDDVADEKAEIE